MVMDKLAAGLLVSSMLANYPDKNLYNAVSKLPQEHRPTVPVELYEDPTPIYANWGMPPNKDASGVVGPDKSKIYVDRTKPSYKDVNRLAGVLAHEQKHVTGGDERDAQRHEYDMLKLLLGRKRNSRLDQLNTIVSAFPKKDK